MTPAGLGDVRRLLAVVKGWNRRHPDDGWSQTFADVVPPLVDEIDAARAALVEALGSEGALPLGGLAAGIRRLAEQRDDHAKAFDLAIEHSTHAPKE